MNTWISLPSRRVFFLQGPECVSFLQGLVTQEVSTTKPTFAALLTPQGRFLCDFFIVPFQEGLLLDHDARHSETLWRFLQRFQILHQVHLTDLSKTYAVCVALGPQAEKLLHERGKGGPPSSLFYLDPRLSEMGVRALVPYVHLSLLPHPLLLPRPEHAYHLHRILKGLAEGAYDLIEDHSIILEYGYQDIGAISWTKGCYPGQELMARTFHRGQIQKKLYRLQRLEGDFPEAGTDLFSLDSSKKVGIMASHCQEWGLGSFYEAWAEPSPKPVSLSWAEEGSLKALLSLARAFP